MKNLKNLLIIFLAVLVLCSAFCASAYATESAEDTLPEPSESATQNVETTEATKEESIPLTDSDETAPTDSSAPTDPSETTDPAETTIPTETLPETDSTETTIPTESASQTEPTETTEPEETQEPTENTQPDTTPKLNKKKLSLEAGKTFTLKVKNSKGERVRYSCDNTKMATVSSSGKVTALKKGTATITARMGAHKFTCKVTVTTNPKLKKAGKVIKEITLKVGERTKVNLVGKAESIKNAYFNTPNAYFGALPTATKLSVVGRKTGTTTIKVLVNNTKYVKLKVIVK